MRKTADRIRHALSFEIIALFIITPLGAMAFDKPIADVGVVALVGATVATLWNYGYNLAFDILLDRFTGTTLKSLRIRFLHAFMFEIGMLALLLPFFAWYLQIGLWEAFVMDLSFAIFYLVYAFVFNWGYDRLFPLPEWSEAQHSVS